MNKWQKGVLGNRVEEDEKILKKIKKAYQEAEKEIDDKIATLLAREDTENLQSIIYQVEYQKALKSQINGILDSLNANQFTSISDYLEQSYENGFIGALYDIHGQGIPFIMSIDQEQVVRVLKNNSKLSKGLWGSLYDRNSALQNRLRAELSRGISQGHSYAQMAKRVSDEMGIGFNNVARIVRTESHRITNEAAMDALYKAKDAGAEIVKQWDATLDGRTRPEHRQLDGQIRELDDAFEVSGQSAQYPGGFGVASLDIYCRCAVLQRAKWALDEEELETLKERAKAFGLDKNDSFEDYKKKYLQIIESPEFVNPYYGKKYVLTPEGDFVEGDNPYNDVYEIDWDGKQVSWTDDADLIMDAATGEVIPKKALKKIQEGEKFDEEVWSLNEDGTFSKGIVKDQAQYKLNLQNNKVLTVDIADWSDVNLDKMIMINESLSKDLHDEIFQAYKASGGAKLEDVLMTKLKEHGYQGLQVVNTNKDTQDKVEGFFKVLDDDVIKKTKKSKLETVTDDLAKAQKKLNKIDNKSYSGIWKDDVSVSDYAAKKDSIQAKKDWYNAQLAMLDPNDAKAKQYKKYLDDLDEFEKLGKEYEKQYNKIEKAKKDIAKLKPKSIGASGTGGEAYSQERKDAAKWFTEKNGGSKAADAAYREKSGEVWRAASESERDAAYKYTSGSGSFNRPLRGYEGSWRNFKGVGKVDLDYEGSGKAIEHLTNLINKSSYDDDIWLQRGVDSRGIASFLGIDVSDLSLSEAALTKKLKDKVVKEEAFMSTAIAKGQGFGGYILNIYAPKGTKMLYCEPFSAFGNGDGRRWNGISKQSSIGYEAEMLLQRGYNYRVTKVTKTGSDWYFDIEVLLDE